MYILPCAKSFYPNDFSRQQAKPKVIIQDVAVAEYVRTSAVAYSRFG